LAEAAASGLGVEGGSDWAAVGSALEEGDWAVAAAG